VLQKMLTQLVKRVASRRDDVESKRFRSGLMDLLVDLLARRVEDRRG